MRYDSIIEIESTPFLSFKLGKEKFIIPVTKIKEILEVPKITKIPLAEKYLVGVINLRGSVLPLIDTRIKFNMGKIEHTINTCVLVLSVDIDGETQTVGALVDSVSAVLELQSSEIKKTPAIATTYDSSYITGMVRDNDEFIMVLDIDRVFL